MKFKSNLLALLAIAFVAVFSIGCGGNNNDNESQFVFTGPTGPTTGSGSLVFKFTSPQTTSAQVPANTTSLRFDVYTGQGGGGTLVFTHTEPFAPQVTLTNVPTTAASVVITAFNSAGFPVGTLTQNVTVTADSSTDVNLSGANFAAVTISSLVATPDTLSIQNGASGSYTITATFSNGVVASIPAASASYVIANPELATVSAAGVFTGTAVGTTTVQITYDHNGSNTTITKNLTVTAANGG